MGSQKIRTDMTEWLNNKNHIIYTTYIQREKSAVLCILDIIYYYIIYTMYVYIYIYQRKKTVCIACYLPLVVFKNIYIHIFLPANAGDLTDTSSVPGWGRSPGGRNGNPLQYSCLENPTDRGAWWATVHGVAESWTWLKQLSTAYIHIFMHSYCIEHSQEEGHNIQ